MLALEALFDEASVLGTSGFLSLTKVKVLGGLLDDTVQSFHVCGEDRYLVRFHILC